MEDRLVDLVDEGVDLNTRIGDGITPNSIVHKPAINYRILRVSPEFIAQHNALKYLTNLFASPYLAIEERGRSFGVWRLCNKEGSHVIKVTDPLSSSYGEIVHQWYLDGQRTALRSWWDVSENIASGHLVQVLPERYQPANIRAAYVSGLATSAKVRITVEFLCQCFVEHYPNLSPEHT